MELGIARTLRNAVAGERSCPPGPRRRSAVDMQWEARRAQEAASNARRLADYLARRAALKLE
ncbi:hypothetical protein Sp245p_26140 (plasmid) [Azospirillum baldaniorum]|uniref:Uncharacterized protein n=1 Tax=Azospirillum baldaniorum TaxID=1064539 RepID=A0A9P1JZR9_9PROT|nr:hypothetical protein Sp245p_26140 [Azospirillum baldaniorum]TWA71901.1 hypothetical protein FBZ84_101167 [Azospirillum baldaniorum]TWA78005.1 hypothetical protein FBZ85_106165 [Azospirillum brasilense]CCD02893.1 protein of unknown function [Azospirillum baldaniorum]